jgi:hypothetical protein
VSACQWVGDPIPNVVQFASLTAPSASETNSVNSDVRRNRLPDTNLNLRCLLGRTLEITLVRKEVTGQREIWILVSHRGLSQLHGEPWSWHDPAEWPQKWGLWTSTLASGGLLTRREITLGEAVPFTRTVLSLGRTWLWALCSQHSWNLGKWSLCPSGWSRQGTEGSSESQSVVPKPSCVLILWEAVRSARSWALAQIYWIRNVGCKIPTHVLTNPTTYFDAATESIVFQGAKSSGPFTKTSATGQF